MKNETPHPLAVEAANEVIHSYVENATSEEGEHISSIIHTTALEPVIKAGEELVALIESKVICGEFGIVQGRFCHTITIPVDDINKAVATWRTLTSPKTGQKESEGEKSIRDAASCVPASEPEAPRTPGCSTPSPSKRPISNP